MSQLYRLLYVINNLAVPFKSFSVLYQVNNLIVMKYKLQIFSLVAVCSGSQVFPVNFIPWFKVISAVTQNSCLLFSAGTVSLMGKSMCRKYTNPCKGKLLS